MNEKNARGRREPVRVGFITPGLLLGGAERWVVSLVKHSDPARIRFTGVAVSPWGGADPLLCEELAGMTELHCKDPRRPPHSNGRFFDATHFQMLHRDWPSAVEGACRGTDIVMAWGGVDLGKWMEKYPVPRVLVSHTTQKERLLQPIAGLTHLAAVSEAAAAYFHGRDCRDIDHRNVAVIYNGADLSRCCPRRGRDWQRHQWGIGRDEIAVGYIGRQSPEKNYLAAAQAINHLPPRFKVVYHGATVPVPGRPAEDLIELAESSRGRVIVRPPETSVGDILAGLDVFVLASHREAFSLGLIEAWLAGVPVVATPVGSVPELQQRHGPLVIDVPPAPRPPALAAAIQRAISGEGARIARKARQLARQQFTCEAMAERWMSYLEEIARPHRQREIGGMQAPFLRRFKIHRRGANRRKIRT